MSVVTLAELHHGRPAQQAAFHTAKSMHLLPPMTTKLECRPLQAHAALLCRVIAWEPMPKFRHFLDYNIALSNFSALVTVR